MLILLLLGVVLLTPATVTTAHQDLQLPHAQQVAAILCIALHAAGESLSCSVVVTANNVTADWREMAAATTGIHTAGAIEGIRLPRAALSASELGVCCFASEIKRSSALVTALGDDTNTIADGTAVIAAAALPAYHLLRLVRIARESGLKLPLLFKRGCEVTGADKRQSIKLCSLKWSFWPVKCAMTISLPNSFKLSF
jgi:hypothetical protein